MDSKKKNISTQSKDWDKSYYLGIDIIDQQHGIFFKLFDELNKLNQENDPFDKLKDVIFELEKYTDLHFETEEAFLVQSNYPSLDLHLIQHQVFKRKIEEFKIAETYRNSVLIDQMIVFMRKWFLMHIAEVDRKYVEDVKKFLDEKSSDNTFN